MKFFTLNNVVIPEGNILKAYKNTCDYVHAVDCPRCGGTGQYGSYGVCYECKGAAKIRKISKGYASKVLVRVLEEKERELSMIEAESKERELRMTHIIEDGKKKAKKAAQIKTLVFKGGNRSSFSQSMGNKAWDVISSGDKVSSKQLEYIIKFLKAGCDMEGFPFDKVLSYFKSFVK